MSCRDRLVEERCFKVCVDVEERPFRAASQAREKGTECRQGRQKRCVTSKTKPIGIIATHPEKSARTGHPA